MLLLTLRDLQHRLVRFLVVVIATGLVFALLLLMSGLANQLLNEPYDAVDSLGAKRWLVPKGVSGPFTSAATLPAGIAAETEGDPLVVARGTLRGGKLSEEVIVIGHEPVGIGAPKVVRGSQPLHTGQLAVDETAGFKIGQRVSLGRSDLEVVGLTRRTTVLAGLPMAFVTIDEAQATLYQGANAAGAIVFRTTSAPARDGYDVLTDTQVADNLAEPLEQAVKSINLVRFLLWIVSAMIIGGVIYLSSMERRRDFAVLKAVGADSKPLLASLALQGAIVAVAAVLLAMLLQTVLAPTFPMQIRVSAATFLQLPVLALIVAMLASAAGMRQVAKVDPALSFS